MASFADYVKDLMGVLPTVNGNPMLSAPPTTGDNARYMEDPFYKSRDIQARDQLVLDEEERKRREAAQAGSGMMAGGGGGEGFQGRNAIQEREDQLRAANLPEEEVQAIMAAEQEERGSRLNSLLTLAAQGIMPGATMFGLNKYGLSGYQDFLQGNMRNMMGDKSGYRSPDYQPKPAGVAAPVVSSPSGWSPDGGSYTSSYGITHDSGSISDAARAGLDAARESFGYGSNADYYGD